ncbi:MAG: ribosome small subunit-dependent GTPase A [Firmicutes bacterium]|nr:ribosome small subunit-dependent GTPase A [Bacillota bacterium]
MIQKNLIIFPPYYEALASDHPGLTLGRIVLQEKGLYHIITMKGGLPASQPAEVSGKFRFESSGPSDFPAVGDYVMVDTNNGDTAIIHRVLHRRSLFLRRAAGTANTEQAVAANIDTVFICMALNNDFNLRRLERYLSAAWESGSIPVVLLTKSDLCDDLDLKLAQVQGSAIGVDILTTSALRNELDSLLSYMAPGKTVAFLGSSGAGKSTLINRLLGEERLKTGGLRNDDRGRHTTTHRELIILPDGAMVIDTPGMRELGMWDASEGIDTAFADIEELAEACRFRDCTHSGEPGCAVCQAIAEGTLSQSRWQSYLKLTAENSYAQDSESYLAAKEKKFKDIAKYNNANTRKRK